MMVLHLASVFNTGNPILYSTSKHWIFYLLQFSWFLRLFLSNLGHSMQHMTWLYNRLLFHSCENFHSIKIPFCEDIVFIQWIQLGIYEKLQIASDKFLLNSHEHHVLWGFLVSNCKFCNHTCYPLICNIKFVEIPIYSVRWIRKNYVFSTL